MKISPKKWNYTFVSRFQDKNNYVTPLHYSWSEAERSTCICPRVTSAALLMFRFTRTKVTSYTARGRGSTSVSLWSTSLRSVSGCRRSGGMSSRKRTTVKALSCLLLPDNMQRMFLTQPPPPPSCCPTRPQLFSLK